jgi:hypothetical protein
MNSLLAKFQKLAEKAELRKGTLRSKEAYMRMARRESPVLSIDRVTERLATVGRLKIGDLITFEYDAKYGEELPYWDRFPLVYVTKIHRDGWTGMNVHYLHPRMRARLFYDLDKNSIDIIDNEMNSLCTKRYLAANTRTATKRSPKEFWEIAVQLPFEKFEKKSNNTVWRQTGIKKKK